MRTAPLCFASRGFSLHAATRIAADNRRGLEQLCRYVARPALAAGRLRILDADQLAFALKTPWSDGTTHLVLSPHELLDKLASLVPPARFNLIRYHGILAPSARGRDKIVPARDDKPETDDDTDEFTGVRAEDGEGGGPSSIDARHLRVRLGPAAQVRLRIGLKRLAHRPTYARPEFECR